MQQENNKKYNNKKYNNKNTITKKERNLVNKMGLKSVNQLLRMADEKKKAVVALDCGMFEEMECVVRAAEKV